MKSPMTTHVGALDVPAPDPAEEDKMKRLFALSAVALAMGAGASVVADLPLRKAPEYLPPPPRRRCGPASTAA